LQFNKLVGVKEGKMPSQEELKFLQSQTLERKVRLTQTRIIEWYQHYKGQVYMSFSGGKDSTVLLDLARRIYPDIEAVFVDTGLEYPEIREFVKNFENVTTIKPKMRFDEVIKKYGYPVISKRYSEAVHKLKSKTISETYRNYLLNGDERGSVGTLPEKFHYLNDAPFKISEQCCGVMKKRPFKKYHNETGKYPITGQMADESRNRGLVWMKNGCNAFNNKNPISNPMSFWTEQDVLHYIKLTNLPYCSVYGDLVPKAEFIGQMAMDGVATDLVMTKCQRTGCMFCMFGAHLEKEPNRFQMMKLTHPKQYDYCIREENGLGLGKVLDFIGVKY